ncbi:MAG: hypothetical protein H7X99_05720 [Saprospiraceae bacterium]|nr:hypothetical protein [Saprospiraceae bacterium]
MRRLISIILFCSICFSTYGQISLDAELGAKLEGKTKFQDIKSTVWTHLTDKLQTLDSKDSSGRKTVLRQMKMWNREFWLNEYYTNEKGVSEPQSKVIMNALAKREREMPKEVHRGQTEGWVSNGPYDCDNGIGRISRLAFDPINQNVIYAGSRFGGLYKSENGGNNWTSISEYVASLGVGGIAVHPTNPNIIYVLSGDGDNTGGSFNGGYFINPGELLSASNGVYKTTDGGMTWIKLPNFEGIGKDSVYLGHKLIIHPTNPDILFAATQIGLFRTDNGGLSWDSISVGIEAVWDIKFKPGQPSTIYIGGINIFKKSINSGINFSTVNIAGISTSTRISIGITPANSSKVVLLCGGVLSNNTFTGIFSSDDSGDTFNPPIQTPNLFSNQIGDPVYTDQSTSDNTIVIDPNNENVIYAGGLCVWKSINGGANWTQVSSYWSGDDPYMHPDIRELAINPLNNKLYSANDGGVHELFEIEWLTKFQGLSTTQFYHFEEENDEDDTWGGTQDNGILERNGLGQNFEEYAGGDGFDVMTDHQSRSSDGNSENVFFTVNEKIKKDCGIGFGDICDISVPENVCNNCPKDFFGNLAMHPVNNEKIYVGYSTGLYASINSGDDWYSLGSTPCNWSICAGKTHPERLYTSGNNASSGSGIWRWDHPNWTPIPVGAPYQMSQKISDIEIDRLDDDHVYVSCAGTIENSKVFESLDAGVSWTNISFNIPKNEPVFCLLRDPSGGLYAGTTIGIYYKRADQNHWEPFYNDLPPVPVTQIVFEEEESIFVHCSTFGRGLWRTLKYNIDCVENRNMTGPVTGRNYWEASNIITSTQNIDDSPGTHISYNAGNKVILSPGLHAKLGSTLKVFATGCGGQVDLSKPTIPKTKTKKQKASPSSDNYKK